MTMNENGIDDAPISNLSPNNDSIGAVLAEATTSSPVKTKTDENVAVFSTTKELEKTNDEGKALVEVSSEENKQEKKNKEEVTAEEEKDGGNVVEGNESKGKDLGKEVEENVAVKGKEVEENVGREQNGENVELSTGKGKKPRKRLIGNKDAQKLAVDGEKPESANKKKLAPKGTKIVALDGDKIESSTQEEIVPKDSEIVADDGDKPESSTKKEVTQKDSEIVAIDADKPEFSGKKKKVKGMGMIFMCSSKTKNDCFRYKVLGLPAAKKDQVEKIYKGMRLFLFDLDLKLLYGIFKAAGPGGYNIQPKAFKSAFPSQVRFSIIRDCLPLAEEKLRKAIKENYYTRNKFDCQLTSQQVKKLCELFTIAGTGPSSYKVGRSLRAPEAPTSAKRRIQEEERNPAPIGREKRKRIVRDENLRGGNESRHSRDDSRHGRDGQRDIDQGKRRVCKETRRVWEENIHLLGRERRYHDHPDAYERDIIPPPEMSLSHPPPPAPPPSYVYERTIETYPYLRDPVLRGPRILESETRHHEDIAKRGPLIVYRDPPLYRDSEYRDSAYMPTQTSEYYAPPPPPVPVEYRLAGRDYHSAAMRPAEYRLSASVQPEYRTEYRAEYPSSKSSRPDYLSTRPLYRY